MRKKSNNNNDEKKTNLRSEGNDVSKIIITKRNENKTESKPKNFQIYFFFYLSVSACFYLLA